MLLRQHNILALPVWDSDRKKYVGIANIIDVLCYIVFSNFTEDGKVSKDFQNAVKPIAELLQLDAESARVFEADVTDSVDDLLDPMSKGVHRMLVHLPVDRISRFSDVDEEERKRGHEHCVSQHKHDEGSFSARLADTGPYCEPHRFPPTQHDRPREDKSFSEVAETRLLTQTDVIRFFCAHADDIRQSLKEENHDNFLAKTIGDLGLASGTVETISSDETALSGFRKMAIHNLSSLAIIDPTSGRLVATLSASDLRGMTSNLIQARLPGLPVTDFLRETRRGRIAYPLITATAQSTLLEVMQKMVNGHVHRVWIVDGYDEGKLLNVISMTDVFKVFLNFNR